MVLFVLGSEEGPFPYPSEECRDWSPDSAPPSHLRLPPKLSMPVGVHCSTQTEGPPAPASPPEPSRLQPVQPSLLAPVPSSLLAPVSPSLTPCPSPVPQRKQRAYAKWENRTSTVLKSREPDEDIKPNYDALETVRFRHHYLWVTDMCSFVYIECTTF